MMLGRGLWVPDPRIPRYVVVNVSLNLVRRRKGACNGRWCVGRYGDMTFVSTVLLSLHCAYYRLKMRIITVQSFNGSLSYTGMLTESRHAKDWLRPPTCSDHWFWLMALPATSHCISKFFGLRLVAHDVRESNRSSFLICVALRTQHDLSYIVFHTLLVLLELISGISKLLLSREAVEWRSPDMLSSLYSLKAHKAIPREGFKDKRLHLSALCIRARVTHGSLKDL